MGFWQGVRKGSANAAQPTRQNSWFWSCLPVHHIGSLVNIEYIIGPISCLASLALLDLLNVTNTIAMANTPFSHFYVGVEDLWDSAVGRNLRRHDRDHPLHLYLEELRIATRSVKSEYGTTGPYTTWNQPGLSPINPNGFARPSTPNGRLYPQWPHTPPDSPAVGQSTNKTLEKLEIQLKDVKKQLEKSENNLTKERERLAAANKLIQEQRKHIEEDRSTFVRLRTRMAFDFIASNKYEQAANQYDKLFDLKAREMRDKRDNKDECGRGTAEEEQLHFKLKYGSALLKQESYIAAEDALRYVHGRLIELHLDHDIRRADTREAQEQLCIALRKQGKNETLSEARKFHAHAAVGLGWEGKRDDDLWKVRNATHLAHVFALQKKYDDTIKQAEAVYSIRSQLSRSCLADVEAQLLDVVNLLERHHESKVAIDLLEILCKNRQGQLSTDMLHGISRLGLLLHERGDHKRATVYLRQAWSQRSLLDDEAERRTGWAHAISLAYTKHYPEAKAILDIFSALGPSIAGPTKDQIKTLTAHIQFYAGEFLTAATTSNDLYTRYKLKSLIPAHPAFHHVETCLRSLSKQDKKEKFHAAEELWQTVYSKKEEVAKEAAAGELLRLWADAGKTLAREWKAHTRKTTSLSVAPRAEKVGREAKEVESLAASVARG